MLSNTGNLIPKYILACRLLLSGCFHIFKETWSMSKKTKQQSWVSHRVCECSFSFSPPEIQTCRQHHVWEPHHCWPLLGLLEEDGQSEDGLLVRQIHGAHRHPPGHQSGSGCHLRTPTGGTFSLSVLPPDSALQVKLCLSLFAQWG